MPTSETLPQVGLRLPRGYAQDQHAGGSVICHHPGKPGDKRRNRYDRLEHVSPEQAPLRYQDSSGLNDMLPDRALQLSA